MARGSKVEEGIKVPPELTRDGEMALSYPAGSSLIRGALPVGEGGRKGEPRGRGQGGRRGGDREGCWLWRWRRGLQAKDSGRLRRLRKTRRPVLPTPSLQKDAAHAKRLPYRSATSDVGGVRVAEQRRRARERGEGTRARTRGHAGRAGAPRNGNRAQRFAVARPLGPAETPFHSPFWALSEADGPCQGSLTLFERVTAFS